MGVKAERFGTQNKINDKPMGNCKRFVSAKPSPQITPNFDFCG